jgi:iron complex transport system permease protein
MTLTTTREPSPVPARHTAAPVSALVPRPPSTTSGLLPTTVIPAVACLLVVALVASIVMAVSVGSVAVPPGTVWRIIAAETVGVELDASIGRNLRQIVWELRLPRVLLAGIVGAGLAVVGVAVQALVRNPLADPYILGISSGASVGAALVILFGLFSSLGTSAISVAAFLTAMATMAVVYLIANESGRLSPMRLVLTGVVVGYVLSAVTSFAIFRADPRASQQVLFWLLGSFGRARWDTLAIPAVAFLAVLAHLWWRARPLDALVAGDSAAITFGVPVGRVRIELFVATAALTGIMVASSGAVGFVGLVVPHAVRMLVGGRHRRVLPLAALLGAVFMIWVDTGARVIASPQELPVGIITALVGGPIFIVLMRRRDRMRRAGAS